MSSDLEWQFGDDFPEGRPGVDPKHHGLRRWLVWGFVIIGIAWGVYAWWNQTRNTLRQAEAQVEQVARLELRALNEGDAELYLSFQDRADLAWYRTQATYLATGGLPLPRQGLTDARWDVRAPRVVGDRARVQVQHTGVLADGRTAVFNAYRFYRLAEQGRWLHAKAQPEERGSAVTFVSDEIELEAREKDADWIGPTVPHLANLVRNYCELAACRMDLPLAVDLSGTLGEAASDDDLDMPAPLQVGRPEGEAALMAWEDELQRFLLDRMVDLEIGSRPAAIHEAELFESRLRVWLRGELAIGPSPTPNLELVWRALDGGNWIYVWELWRVSPGDPKGPLAEAEIDLLLAFIAQEYTPAAVARLPRALGDAAHPGEAIAAVVPEAWWVFRRRYLTYVRRVLASRYDPLTSFSSYDLIGRCWETLDATSAREI